MRYIEAKVNGRAVHLDVLRETPQADGTVRVLVLVSGGARTLVVDPDDIKEAVPGRRRTSMQAPTLRL